MSKINLEYLNLTNNTIRKIVNVNNIEVHVLTYLPLENKIDLIESVIDKSLVDEEAIYCNPLLLKVLFELNIVAYYSDINIDLDGADIMSLYDLLTSTGVISKIIDTIPNEEYVSLMESLYECKEAVETENSSIITLIKEGIIRITDMVNNSNEKLKELNLDLSSENLQNVLAIARDNGAI